MLRSRLFVAHSVALLSVSSWVVPESCGSSALPPSLFLQPLADLLRAWPPPETVQPPSVLNADVICAEGCSAPPLLDFDSPLDRCRASRFAEAKLPFVIRNAPGTRAVSALWTREYLYKRIHGDASQGGLELHTFEGDEYKTGRAGNARAALANATSWWADWNADVSISADAGVFPPAHGGSAAAPAPAQRRRRYLQVTSGERPFLAADLAPLFNGWISAHPATADSASMVYTRSLGSAVGSLVVSEPDEAAAAARHLFSPDPAVSAHTPVECRFGFRGTRVEAHFDTYENFVFLGAGRRRYILAPPQSCEHLSVSRAPSRLRHSLVDWASPATWDSAPFSSALGTQAVLEAGDVLYIPAFWFHAIVSLTHTAQCSKMVGKAVFPQAALQCIARSDSVILQRPPPEARAARGVTYTADDAASGIGWRKVFEHGQVSIDGEAPVAVARTHLPPAMSFSVMDALAPDWRSAPWWLGATLTPYSDAAAARLERHGIPPLGWLFKQWRRISAAYTALVTEAPPRVVLDEAQRWAPLVSDEMMLELRDALRLAASARCLKAAALSHSTDGTDVCAASKTALFAHVTLRLPGAPTGCQTHPVSDALVAIEARLEGGYGGEVLLTVHPLGAMIFCPPATDPVSPASEAARARSTLAAPAPSDTPLIGAAARAGRILRGLTDIGAARESACYSYRYVDGERTAATVRVFALPSLHGLLGRLLSIRANMQGLVDTGVVSQSALAVIAAFCLGPLALPVLLPVWLWRRRRERRAIRGGAGG